MRELADIVLFLKDAYRPADLVKFADKIRASGAEALGHAGLSDLRTIAERELRGRWDPHLHRRPQRRLGILAGRRCRRPERGPTIQSPLPQVQPLAFTVPTEASGLIRPAHRIDLLIGEVIRDATQHLVVGSPYWNAGGLETLRPAIEAALQVRQVTCDFFTHSPEDHGQVLIEFAASLPRRDLTRVWVYDGAEGSLMHAKFVVSDVVRGLLRHRQPHVAWTWRTLRGGSRAYRAASTSAHRACGGSPRVWSVRASGIGVESPSVNRKASGRRWRRLGERVPELLHPRSENRRNAF